MEEKNKNRKLEEYAEELTKKLKNGDIKKEYYRDALHILAENSKRGLNNINIEEER